MKNLFMILAAGVLFTSCATHYGTISSNVIESNIQYTDIAVGVAQTNHIFGIGGLSKDALVYQAKMNLVKSHQLKPNERLINYTVDFKRSFWAVFVKLKVTVSAEVVSLTESDAGNLYSEDYLQAIHGNIMSNGLYEIGDSVLINNKAGKIISAEKREKVYVEYRNGQGNLVAKKITVNKLFARNKSYKGHLPGEKVVYTDFVNRSQGKRETTLSGTIVGVGLNHVLIRNGNGKRNVVGYDKLIKKF